MKTLLKIDRSDGIIAERFVVGSAEYLEETARLATLLFVERGNVARADLRRDLESGRQYTTAAFLYSIQEDSEMRPAGNTVPGAMMPLG